MGDRVFNVSKGAVVGYHNRVNDNDPAGSGLVGVLLKSAGLVADDTMVEYPTLAAILAGASDECDFTNYGRWVLTDADIVASTVDDVNNRHEADTADQIQSAAGGTVDNAMGALVWCYDPDVAAGDDTTIVPLTKHDFVGDTNGGDITAVIANYFRAQEPA